MSNRGGMRLPATDQVMWDGFLTQLARRCRLCGRSLPGRKDVLKLAVAALSVAGENCELTRRCPRIVGQLIARRIAKSVGARATFPNGARILLRWWEAGLEEDFELAVPVLEWRTGKLMPNSGQDEARKVEHSCTHTK